MCDFKVGDEVVCIDDNRDWLGLEPVFVGRVYVVARVYVGLPTRTRPDIDRAAGVDLVGLPTHPGLTYPASCFRKVQRRNLTAWLATENTIEGPVRRKVSA